MAKCGDGGDPEISYQDVDTSLIPPRPRLYGLVGGEVIEEVWNDRQKARRDGAAAPAGLAHAGAAG